MAKGQEEINLEVVKEHLTLQVGLINEISKRKSSFHIRPDTEDAALKFLDFLFGEEDLEDFLAEKEIEDPNFPDGRNPSIGSAVAQIFSSICLPLHCPTAQLIWHEAFGEAHGELHLEDDLDKDTRLWVNVMQKAWWSLTEAIIRTSGATERLKWNFLRIQSEDSLPIGIVLSEQARSTGDDTEQTAEEAPGATEVPKTERLFKQDMTESRVLEAWVGGNISSRTSKALALLFSNASPFPSKTPRQVLPVLFDPRVNDICRDLENHLSTHKEVADFRSKFQEILHGDVQEWFSQPEADDLACIIDPNKQGVANRIGAAISLNRSVIHHQDILWSTDDIKRAENFAKGMTRHYPIARCRVLIGYKPYDEGAVQSNLSDGSSDMDGHWDDIKKKLLENRNEPAKSENHFGVDIATHKGLRFVVLLSTIFKKSLDDDVSLFHALLEKANMLAASASTTIQPVLYRLVAERTISSLIDDLISIKMKENPKLEDFATWLGKSIPTARRIRDRVKKGESPSGSLQLNRESPL